MYEEQSTAKAEPLDLIQAGPQDTVCLDVQVFRKRVLQQYQLSMLSSFRFWYLYSLGNNVLNKRFRKTESRSQYSSRY